MQHAAMQAKANKHAKGGENVKESSCGGTFINNLLFRYQHGQPTHRDTTEEDREVMGRMIGGVGGRLEVADVDVMAVSAVAEVEEGGRPVRHAH